MSSAVPFCLIVCGLLALPRPVYGSGAVETLEFGSGTAMHAPAVEIETGAAPAAEQASLYVAELAVPLFEAISDNDVERLRLLLNQGADPDAIVPHPLPENLSKRIQLKTLSYNLNHERGFTALMLASALGRETAVRFLLTAGADRNKKTTPARLFALVLASKRGHFGIARLLMGIGPGDPPARVRVEVDLSAQRATAWRGDKVLGTTRVSSGKAATPTPPGTYIVTSKHKHWKSTIFHVRMPYFLRLSCGDFGLHAGVVPGYPASHGCVRLPESKARQFFSQIPIGAMVTIR